MGRLVSHEDAGQRRGGPEEHGILYVLHSRADVTREVDETLHSLFQCKRTELEEVLEQILAMTGSSFLSTISVLSWDCRWISPEMPSH